MKWNPSAHDIARLKRLTAERGRYVNCRHYRKRPDAGLFDCTRHGEGKRNCNGCPTCPNCDGRLALYKTRRERGMGQDFIYRQKSCVHCGAFVEEEYVVSSPKAKGINKRAAGNQKCEVRDCPNTAYEGHVHVEDVDGVALRFIICESHRRRLKTWRLHPDKGEQQKPVQLQRGTLVDNPDYKKKQKRRNADAEH